MKELWHTSAHHCLVSGSKCQFFHLICWSNNKTKNKNLFTQAQNCIATTEMTCRRHWYITGRCFSRFLLKPTLWIRKWLKSGGPLPLTTLLRSSWIFLYSGESRSSFSLYTASSCRSFRSLYVWMNKTKAVMYTEKHWHSDSRRNSHWWRRHGIYISEPRWAWVPGRRWGSHTPAAPADNGKAQWSACWDGEGKLSRFITTWKPTYVYRGAVLLQDVHHSVKANGRSFLGVSEPVFGVEQTIHIKPGFQLRSSAKSRENILLFWNLPQHTWIV